MLPIAIAEHLYQVGRIEEHLPSANATTETKEAPGITDMGPSVFTGLGRSDGHADALDCVGLGPSFP